MKLFHAIYNRYEWELLINYTFYIVYLCAKIITDGKILQHRWTADF